MSSSQTVLEERDSSDDSHDEVYRIKACNLREQCFLVMVTKTVYIDYPKQQQSQFHIEEGNIETDCDILNVIFGLSRLVKILTYD